jgi:tetratricopeptide (TPR) repeat protein
VHRSAYREAAALYEQGLNAVERQIESPQCLAQGIDVRLDLAGALSALDRYDRVSGLAIEAETLATRLGDRRRLARATTLACFGLVNTGEPVAAVDAGRRALDLASELADLALEVHASQRLGMAFLSVGELALATDCLRRTVQMLRGEDADARLGESLALWHRAMAGGRLCVVLAEMGAFAESLGHEWDAVGLALSTGRSIRAITERTRLGEARLLKGDVTDAISLLEPALAEAREHEVLEWIPVAASCLARAYAVAGHLGEAVPLAEEAGQLAPGRTEIIRRLGEVYVTARRLDAALDCARRAIAMARKRQERGEEAKALRLLGEIAARRDPPEGKEAEERYLEGRALAERLGFRPEVAHCHLGLGRILSLVGPSDRAREHREAAVALFRDMGMASWLGQLDAEADRVARG